VSEASNDTIFTDELLKTAHFLVWRSHRIGLGSRIRSASQLTPEDPVLGDFITYLQVSRRLLGARCPDWLRTFRRSGDLVVPGVLIPSEVAAFHMYMAMEDLPALPKGAAASLARTESDFSLGRPSQPDPEVRDVLLAARSTLKRAAASSGFQLDDMATRFVALLETWLKPPDEPVGWHHPEFPRIFFDEPALDLAVCERRYLSEMDVDLPTAARRSVVSRTPLQSLRRSGAVLAATDAKRGTINLGMLADALDWDVLRLPSSPTFEPVTKLKLGSAGLYFHHAADLATAADRRGTRARESRPLIEIVPSGATLRRMNEHGVADSSDRNRLASDMIRHFVLEDPEVAFWLEAYAGRTLPGLYMTEVRVLTYGIDRIRWAHALYSAHPL